MGPSDLFRRRGPTATPSVATDKPPPVNDGPPLNSAKVSHEPLKFKEGKPYLALIGQTFDVWGVVDVVGDTRSHIAVKELPAAILKRIALTGLDEVAAIERKIVLTHTKGFQELPREDALNLITILSDNLTSYNEEMKERLDNATQDYDNDARGLREFLRDLKKEYAEYWAEEINKFRNELLPQAAADYWECQRDESKGTAELAERARVRALAKIRKPS
jgi:hypothetical protein